MRVEVIAHPNSKKPRVEKDLLNTLHIYVKEPPLEGRANMAVIEALAKYFNISKNCVQFVSGERSKIKVFQILT